jgi:hypothetical protein
LKISAGREKLKVTEVPASLIRSLHGRRKHVFEERCWPKNSKLRVANYGETGKQDADIERNHRFPPACPCKSLIQARIDHSSHPVIRESPLTT